MCNHSALRGVYLEKEASSLHMRCPVDYLYESCINVDQLEPAVAPGQLLQEAVHPAVPLPQGVGHVAPGQEGLGVEEIERD